MERSEEDRIVTVTCWCPGCGGKRAVAPFPPEEDRFLRRTDAGEVVRTCLACRVQALCDGRGVPDGGGETEFR